MKIRLFDNKNIYIGQLINFSKLSKAVLMLLIILPVLAACSAGNKEKPFETVEAYLESEEIKEYSQQLIDQFSETDMVLEFDATEDTFIYLFTVPLQVDADKFAETVGPGVEEQEKQYIKAAKSVKELVNQDTIKILVKYYDPKGTLLYEKEFASN